MSSQMNNLMLRVLVFVDRNGQVIGKESTPMSYSLDMEYEDKGLEIKIHAFAHVMGNGACNATVKYNSKVVFQAAGNFTFEPYNVKAKTYVPGEWESLIPKIESTREEN